jgi:hypothetical protein
MGISIDETSQETSEERIARRVAAIRDGASITGDLREILAEMDRGEAEFAVEEQYDAVEEDDPVEVEVAWGEEIRLRIGEILDGSVKTYDAEDVMTAMRLRFG